MPKLIIFSRSGRNEVEIDEHCIIGRHTSNHITILDPGISSVHSLITFEFKQGFVIRDLGSLNGTFVNNKKLDGKLSLNDGDEIRLGNTRCIFSSMTPGTVVQIIDEKFHTIHSHFSPISAPKVEKPFLSAKEMPDEAVLRVDYEKLRITHELQRGINFDMSIDNILDHVLNCTFELLPCDRGIILIPNKNGVLKPRAYKTTSQENRFIISNTLVRYLQKNKKGIVFTDAMADDRFNGAESIIKQGTRSTIAVPILDQTHMIGIIILESSTAVSAYNAKDLLLLTNIANQTSRFIKTSEMAKKIKEDAITRKRFQRLLSPNLAEMIVSGQLKVERGGENRVATVLFADIRDFTLLSENARATDVLRMLNDYFEVAVDIIFHHEGTVDKFIGDAIMAIWGAPVAHDNDPIRAVRAAIDIQHLLVEFNKTRAAEGQSQIQVGIGINTGDLVAGYIGSSRTMSYSVIGKTVNTAYRLCSAAKPGQILISEHTQNQVQNAFNITELESIPAKGKFKPIRTFNVLDSNGNALKARNLNPRHPSGGIT
ncbi:MAG: FHA domain-containing protein [Deltaproteobacteria bacterium]|nr:FHA domain-containing protein [Deltaproteobacteria bacterium]